MRYDESFGVIPLSQKRGRWEVFLIQHQRGGYWGFPKGHAEQGETPYQAALRELQEETHLEVVRLLREEPFVEQYQFSLKGKRISKQVSYFAAEVFGTVQLQQQEIQDGIWLPISDALHRLTHQEGKDILSRVTQILA